jgi:hypothetical protein
MAKVDSRDVLDPNAKTSKAFRGRILGYYRPTGANAWDDYEYVSQQEEAIEILPDLPVQLEKRGPRLRLRVSGRVVVLEWLPSEREREQIGQNTPSALRKAFIERHLVSFAESAGIGASAVIAKKLTEEQ